MTVIKDNSQLINFIAYLSLCLFIAISPRLIHVEKDEQQREARRRLKSPRQEIKLKAWLELIL
jgi:energy-converting hydrogenase Eha subunit H